MAGGNSVGLIYEKIDSLCDRDIIVTRPPTVFKDVRRAIKPDFPDSRLQYDNFNGQAAIGFGSMLGKHGWDWIKFSVEGNAPRDLHIPSDAYLNENRLLCTTEFGDEDEWRARLVSEISQQRLYLLVELGINLREGERQKTWRPAFGGVLESYFPRALKVLDACLTNAPSCWCVRDTRY
ncbi:MAG: hypothetical protein HY308_00590 [Gammaproteobacteria bacterium]|nr:hypothetical protein [Gammaproteobacteria bacterium]